MAKTPSWKLPRLPTEFRDPSGLVRLRPEEQERVRLPEGLVLPRDVVAMSTPPSFEDYLYCYTTAQELLSAVLEPEFARLVDLPPLELDAIVDALGSVPFEPAMRYLASVQKTLRMTQHNPAMQVAFLQHLFGDDIAAAGAAIMRSEQRRAVLCEQQIFALQRLLVLHARDDDAPDLSAEEADILKWSLLWVPDTILDPELDLDRDDEIDLDDQRWLCFFVGHGGLAMHGAMRHELARAHRLYHVIARSRAARRRQHEYCPLNEWLADRYGMTFHELQAVGFGLYAGSKTLSDHEPPSLVDPAYFAPAAFASRVRAAFPALSAPREWFRHEFEASPEHPRRAGFEIQPFLRRPGLLQRNGSVCVIAPRAIEGWLSSTGWFYRFLDIAREEGMLKRFQQFNGFLLERYALHLAYSAHPDQAMRRRLVGTGRVYPEKVYRVPGGESKTSDVAIDLGTDLVLFEMTGKRVTAKSLVEADASSVLADLRMLLLDNMKQLGRVIRDLAARTAQLDDDLTFEYVHRVWPVIVCPDGLFQSPSLWAWIEREGARFFRFSPELARKVQPLTVLDLEEYEALMGLVRREKKLVSVLETKTGPLWRHRDLKSWLIYAGKEAELVQKDWIADELSRAFSAITCAYGGRLRLKVAQDERAKAA